MKSKTKSDALRLALVGCGGISGAHVAGFRELWAKGCRDIVFTACCDTVEENRRRRAKELAEIQGTDPAIFSDLQTLIKSKVADAVDACLPHHLHHSVGEEVLAAGLHLLVEKPVGITIRAARRLIAAAKKAKRVLATAENTRRCLPSRAAAWAIRDRKIVGEMLMANIQGIGYGPFDYNNPAFKWRGVKVLTGGGLLMDSGAHFADMQMLMFGEPLEAYCTLATYDRRTIPDAPVVGSVQPDIEDTWHAVIRFRNGMQTVWTYGRQFPTGASNFGHYYGTEGTMEDLSGWRFHCFEGGGQAILPGNKIISRDQIEKDYLLSLPGEAKERLFPHGCSHSFGIEIWDFADAVRKGRKPEIDGEEGMATQALCMACYESAASGDVVKYADVLNGKVERYQEPINQQWKI